MSDRPKLKVPEQTKKDFVSCVQSAVGDEIKEDMLKLRTTNSRAARIWDLINTDLYDISDVHGCKTYLVHRGPWGMVVVYEPATCTLYTFMREARFKQIRKKVRAGEDKSHYLRLLVKSLNGNLECQYQEDALFPDEAPEKLSEKDNKIIDDMLVQLRADQAKITNHVVVLFESVTRPYQLVSIRAVMLDKNLAVFSQEDWTRLITVEESAIIDPITNSNAPENNPSHGLKLKAKSLRRKEVKDKNLKTANKDNKKSQ